MAPNFPTRAPIGLLAGGLLAVLSVIPIFAGWRAWQRPVQKFYLSEYASSFVSQTPVGTVAAFFRHGGGRHTYYVLVQKGRLVSADGPEIGSPVSVSAVAVGSPGDFHSWLRSHMYGGREIFDLLRTPFLVWVCTGAGWLSLGALADFYRRKRVREGIQLRGGEILSVDQFNRATKGDGFGLYVEN